MQFINTILSVAIATLFALVAIASPAQPISHLSATTTSSGRLISLPDGLDVGNVHDAQHRSIESFDHTTSAPTTEPVVSRLETRVADDSSIDPAASLTTKPGADKPSINKASSLGIRSLKSPIGPRSGDKFTVSYLRLEAAYRYYPNGSDGGGVKHGYDYYSRDNPCNWGDNIQPYGHGTWNLKVYREPRPPNWFDSNGMETTPPPNASERLVNLNRDQTVYHIPRASSSRAGCKRPPVAKSSPKPHGKSNSIPHSKPPHPRSHSKPHPKSRTKPNSRPNHRN